MIKIFVRPGKILDIVSSNMTLDMGMRVGSKAVIVERAYMFKVMWLLRRKAGITHEQFRDHYERSHALLGQKYLGHLLIEYRRNYRTETWGRAQPDGRLGPMDWTHDCVTEWVMPNREAFEEVTRILADPVIGREFHEDEEHFLDRDSVFLVMCDPVDTGTGLAMPARQAGPVG